MISQDRAGDSSFYHFDGIGNVRALTDDLGAQTDEYLYDAWGKAFNTTGTTANAFTYKGEAGYYRDPDLGPEDSSYTLHHRHYAAGPGRFKSMDPAEDDANLYRYVRNNPVNSVDPSGLAEEDGIPDTPKELMMIDSEYSGAQRWLLLDALGNRVGVYDKSTGYVMRSISGQDFGPIDRRGIHINDMWRTIAGEPSSNSSFWDQHFLKDGALGSALAKMPKPVLGGGAQDSAADIDLLGKEIQKKQAMGLAAAGPAVAYFASYVARELAKDAVLGKIGGKIVGVVTDKLADGVWIVIRSGRKTTRRLATAAEKAALKGHKAVTDAAPKGSLDSPNPKWKSTWVDDTAMNARRLRENMGPEAFDAGDAAHHLVPGRKPKAQRSRDLLDRYQIDINSADNGVALDPGVHSGRGLHTDRAIQAVEDRLSRSIEGVKNWGMARQKIIETLGQIRVDIGAGKFRFN